MYSLTLIYSVGLYNCNILISRINENSNIRVYKATAVLSSYPFFRLSCLHICKEQCKRDALNRKAHLKVKAGHRSRRRD